VGACPNGAVPGPNAPATGWVWVGLAAYAGSKLPEWLRIIPWLGAALGNQLLNVSTLCNSNPDPAPGLTPADYALAGIDLVAGPLIGGDAIAKIWQNIYYDAFQQWCVCNAYTPPAGGPCFSYSYHAGPSDFGTFHIPGLFPTADGWYYPLDPAGIPITSVPNCTFTILSTSQPNPFGVNIYTLPSNTSRMLSITDTPAPFSWTVDLSSAVTAGDTGWRLMIQGAQSGFPPAVPNPLDLQVDHKSTGSCPATIPGPHVDVTINVPTAPALKCDATTLCEINWAIQNQTNVGINVTNTGTTQILDEHPTTYGTGASYTVSGQGVQVVAQATLGLVVQLDALPSGAVPTSTDPPRYYDIGWIMMGAGDALDGKKWLHSSGDRFIPAFPEIDRFHYNLSPDVQITVTELVPPAPSS
jgi:hypothetical protein